MEHIGLLVMLLFCKCNINHWVKKSWSIFDHKLRIEVLIKLTKYFSSFILCDLGQYVFAFCAI